MAGVGVYDQLKKVLQDVIAPDLHAIRADIRSLDQKIDGVDAKLTMKIDGVDARTFAPESRVERRANACRRYHPRSGDV